MYKFLRYTIVVSISLKMNCGKVLALDVSLVFCPLLSIKIRKLPAISARLFHIISLGLSLYILL